MLPDVDALFTLVGQLARRAPVTEVAVPTWLVQRHGLAPLVARAGEREFREDLARASLEWARVSSELPAIVTHFVEAGVRVAPIKGAAYATTLYDAPAERPMSDVDLLVPPSQVAPARQALVELGFVQAETPLLHHAGAWVRDGLMIDLHRSIIAPGRSRIDLDDIWARTTPGWPSGAEQLDPVDAIVFHLVHMTRNRLRVPLINVIDAARLMARIDAMQLVLSRAKRWGLGSGTHLALSFCESILTESNARPAGWLGPTREEVALLAEPSAVRKVVFDVATSGSLVQLAARVVGYGANKVNAILRGATNST